MFEGIVNVLDPLSIFDPVKAASWLGPLLYAFAVILIARSGLMLALQRKGAAKNLFFAGIALGVFGSADALLIPLVAILQAFPWILLLAIAFFGLALLQTFAALFMGKDAAADMTGTLAADVVRFFFRLLFLPFRLLARLFGGRARR